jgi:ATP-dependent Clp protease adapter protein ClpS
MTEQLENQQPTKSDGDSATAVATRPRTTPAPTKVDRLPPWRVLLHNDDHSAMDEVVLAIQKVTHLTMREAFMRMLEAHTRGIAVLVETHREHAELLVEQFATFKLIATAEPAPG